VESKEAAVDNGLYSIKFQIFIMGGGDASTTRAYDDDSTIYQHPDRVQFNDPLWQW
jgi:hypothetical protein